MFNQKIMLDLIKEVKADLLNPSYAELDTYQLIGAICTKHKIPLNILLGFFNSQTGMSPASYRAKVKEGKINESIENMKNQILNPGTESVESSRTPSIDEILEELKNALLDPKLKNIPPNNIVTRISFKYPHAPKHFLFTMFYEKFKVSAIHYRTQSTGKSSPAGLAVTEFAGLIRKNKNLDVFTTAQNIWIKYGISEAELTREFKKRFGTTPIAFSKVEWDQNDNDDNNFNVVTKPYCPITRPYQLGFELPRSDIKIKSVKTAWERLVDIVNEAKAS